ncbi:MAG: ZIP family metal transporter [Phycisphaerales bacterium]
MAASLLGGAVPALVGLTHRRLQFGLSFVSGAMMGVAVFHMLPHAAMARMEALESAASPAVAGPASAVVHAHDHSVMEPLMVALVLGFLAMFFLERFAHFHQHELPEPACDSPEHGHAGHHHPPAKGVGRLTWTGAAVGLGLHSLLEGVALAASVAAASELGGGSATALAGLGTFLVIVLHKPFDALTLTTLFRAGGGTRAQMLAINVGFAALVPAGAALFLMGVQSAEDAAAVVPLALAFSAGTFLCIAASDLLPEVQFHRHDRVGLSAALVLGLALAWGLAKMEAGAHEADEHDHAGHVHADHTHDHAHDHATTDLHSSPQRSDAP